MLITFLLTLSLFALQTPSPMKSADFDSFRLGNPADITTKPIGGLQLEGGGTDQPEAFQWLVKHANGGDVLVIRASGTDAYNPFIAKQGTANSVETIVFKNRNASTDPYVLDRLAHAEAIFLAGGDQGNYIKYWKDTPVEDAINAAAKRGVPIGGTSAGLAVMSEFSFAALNDSIVSKDALANPFDEKVTIERDFLALPHMKGLITDSHWIERDRLGRTLVFMARLIEDGSASPAHALAIDSTTAVLMEVDGTATVVGKTSAYFMSVAKKAEVCKRGEPLTMRGIQVYRVQPGGRFNLKTWKGEGGLAYTLDVIKGVVTSSRGDLDRRSNAALCQNRRLTTRLQESAVTEHENEPLEQEIQTEQNEPEEDFAAMFAASQQTQKLKNGQAIDGTIVAIGAEVAFVNVGGKGEATISLAELKDDEGVMQFAAGDRIRATVMLTPEGLTLSRKLQRGAASAQQVADAFQAGIPVEGKVDKAVKAGYEVRVAGLRAFCPNSQIDIVRDTAPETHIGRVYTFKIVDFSEGGQKFVVSRRALQEVEQAAKAVEVRQSITVGAVITGRVASVRDFGAFIELGGGVQGLLHVSEMGWSRVTDPSNLFKAGEEITVKVLRVEDEKIALGLKQLSDDPWSSVASKYSIGQVVPGKITRLAEFGAFVELEDGVEGLAHASTFAPQAQRAGWAKSVKTGLKANFEVLSIDPVKKRIGVAIVDEGSSKSRVTAAAAADAEQAADVRDYATRETAAQSEGFGSLADKLRGALTKK